MIFAREVSGDSAPDLALAFARMGLPRPAREYLVDKLTHLQVLLTGLEIEDGRLLRRLCEREGGYERFPRFASGDQSVRPGTALLSGRLEQLERLADEAHASSRGGLSSALRRLLEIRSTRPAPLELRGKRFVWGERTYSMGILNVTPDSFSDGGRHLRVEAAVAHGEALAKAGVDLLDVGGESTRPGARSVEADEEAERIIPVIRALCERVGIPISVDTSKASVAEAALDAGAQLVNDVSGFSADPKMAQTVAARGAACCLMHMRGSPRTMQDRPAYIDVVEEVLAFLDTRVAHAVAAGVAKEKILVDPGIGFGKTLGHNLFLLRRLGDLRGLGCAVTVGTSRKSSLGALVGSKPPEERLAATLGSLAAVAVLGGADVVRVHDVAEAKDALVVADAIRRASDGGEGFSRPSRRQSSP